MGNSKKNTRSKPKFHVKSGDLVKVISGDDKGTEGKVLSVDYKTSRAYVEGVRMITKHTKPTAENPDGGIVETEAGVHVSNLMLVDPKTGEVTKVGRKEVEGKIVRYSKKSGEEI